MTRRLQRIALIVAVASLAFAMKPVPAPAALAMSTGLRILVESAPPDECSTKAQAAMKADLTSSFEAGAGTGQFLGYGPLDNAGHPTAAAAIHCYPVGKGYVVTFTCAVEVPPNPYGADDLCNRLGNVFQGKASATLATPTPPPTGCALNNLVGTWVDNTNSKNTLTMDVNGGLTDQDGVVGSWALAGTTATITHYGSKTATLSSDGKHLSGGLSYTRKC